MSRRISVGVQDFATLTLSMLDYFFSTLHPDRSDLFRNLSIWNSPEYRTFQDVFPVISISFAKIKEVSFAGAVRQICEEISRAFRGKEVEIG